MSVSIHFPDGVELKAPDAEALLRAVGKMQWTPTEDVHEVKRAMSDRAWVWSRTAISPELPADEFLTALEASGMVAVVHSPEPAKPRAREPEGDE